MDKEIFYINSILLESEEPLTNSDISKRLYDKYNIKVSRQIVKNYLWSYFRNLIRYDSSNYTYALKEKSFISDDIYITSVENSPRTINARFDGGRLELEYDRSKSIEEIIKAIGIINFTISSQKKQLDLIKQINRIIEQENNE